jgi:hypothetical protein
MKKILASLAVVLLFISLEADAQTANRTIVQTVKAGDWNDASIWEGGIIPGISSIVIIRHNVTVTGNVSCYSLQVDTANNLVDPLRAGLIAYYPFNGNALDESGNQYHLSIHDAILANNRFGEASKAYSFDGVKAFMKIPGLMKADSLREFTISVWIKTEVLMDHCILSLLPKNTRQYCSSSLNFHNKQSSYEVIHKMVNRLTEDFCSASIIGDNTPNPLNKWTHLVVVQRYKTEIGLFPVNGYSHYFNSTKLKGTSSGDNPIPIFFTSGGVIGCDNNSGNFDFNFRFTKGSIDDVRIYNRALSDDEIMQLYHLDF